MGKRMKGKEMGNRKEKKEKTRNVSVGARMTRQPTFSEMG